MYKLVIFDFDGALADCAGRAEAPVRRAFFAGRLRRGLEQGAEAMRLVPGAKALLRRLAGHGVVLGVVSSASAAEVRRILGPEAAALVEHYACGSAVFGKASKLRKLVRRARVKPAEALCIGGASRDIEAARAAGIVAGMAAWGQAGRELLAERAPAWLFNTPDEVAARLAA